MYADTLRGMCLDAVGMLFFLNGLSWIPRELRSAMSDSFNVFEMCAGLTPMV